MPKHSFDDVDRMNPMEVLWYWCQNDVCLRYRTLTDVLPGEEATCSSCGQYMHATDPPPLGSV